MKVAPANVTYYSNSTDMIARYQTVHALFWPPVRKVVLKTKPKPKLSSPRPVQPPPRVEPPEPPPPPERATERASLRRLPDLPLIDQITRAVCEEFNLTKTELWSERRTLNVVRPRHLAFSLCKHLTTRSLPEIGRRFGGRDHTTVLNGVRKMAPFLDATKDGMPPDATLPHWVRVMREHMDDYEKQAQSERLL